jgi:hypothetical protein
MFVDFFLSPPPEENVRLNSLVRTEPNDAPRPALTARHLYLEQIHSPDFYSNIFLGGRSFRARSILSHSYTGSLVLITTAFAHRSTADGLEPR